MSNKYDGPERRQGYCDMHMRHLDQIEGLQREQSSLKGWQKAHTFFITACVSSVVMLSVNTNSSVERIAKSMNGIDKQLATVISSSIQKTKNQEGINRAILARLENIDLSIRKIELLNANLNTRLSEVEKQCDRRVNNGRK